MNTDESHYGWCVECRSPLTRRVMYCDPCADYLKTGHNRDAYLERTRTERTRLSMPLDGQGESA